MLLVIMLVIVRQAKLVAKPPIEKGSPNMDDPQWFTLGIPELHRSATLAFTLEYSFP